MKILLPLKYHKKNITPKPGLYCFDLWVENKKLNCHLLIIFLVTFATFLSPLKITNIFYMLSTPLKSKMLILGIKKKKKTPRRGRIVPIHETF